MTNNRIRARMPRLLLADLVCLAGPIFAQTRLNYSIFFPSSHRNSVLAAEWASGRPGRKGSGPFPSSCGMLLVFVKSLSESLRTVCMVLMLIAVTVMIGVVIPLVAMNVFVVKNITKVPFGTIYKGVAPFLVSLVLAAALLFLVPQLATFLPALLMK